jgi:hypothetical protein
MLPKNAVTLMFAFQNMSSYLLENFTMPRTSLEFSQDTRISMFLQKVLIDVACEIDTPSVNITRINHYLVSCCVELCTVCL